LGLRKKLGPSAGIDPKDDKAVRQFDRKRPGKSSVTSNLKIGTMPMPRSAARKARPI